ncbi:uncharacterized protein LOC105682972 [Athalia rosae]|uniref:uncharacterized protein LOC105682972 n=1 Tax=Athalia rosae TaxID=37344 RepID=UPI00203368CF|nr:uncharacterized protein LOC105682972 [Athalia rosae]XP_048512823.1 uncharacterized protein LOC105682972 [Athalia rosae]
MDNFQIFIFFFVCSIFKDIGGININVVSIPKIVRDGTEEPIVLDCDYEMGKSSNTGLTIKWYIGQDLLYQWIQGTPPKASEEFLNHVDASYRASDDPDTMYRAVKLVRPGPDLSGEYRCVVFTHDDEDEARGRMLVYSPEHRFRLLHLHRRNDDANRQLIVECIAEGVFPQPKITLLTDAEVIRDQEHLYLERADGRFDVKAVAVLDTETLQLPITLKCELYIQEANYTAIREYVYSGSSEPPELSMAAYLLFAVVFFVDARG